MGCFMIVLAGILALAVPASVARTSLVGAYVVIVLLAAAAVATIVWTARRRAAATGTAQRLSTALTRVGILVVGYAVLVTIIHAA